LPARLRAEQIAQLAFERAAIDPHVEPFMAAIAGERDFLAGRDDATLIRIEFDGVFSDRRLTLAREGAEQAKPFSLRKLAARGGAPIAIDKADVLKLNEAASRRQSFGRFDLGIGRAVPRQQGMPEFLRIGGLKYRKPLQRIDERLKRHGSVCSRRSRWCLFKMPQVALIGVEAIGLYPLSEEAVRRTVASLYRFKYQRMPRAGSRAYRLCTNVSISGVCRQQAERVGRQLDAGPRDRYLQGWSRPTRTALQKQRSKNNKGKAKCESAACSSSQPHSPSLC
jgi:hypothetical protein